MCVKNFLNFDAKAIINIHPNIHCIYSNANTKESNEASFKWWLNGALKKRENSGGKKQRGIREMVNPLPLHLSFPPFISGQKETQCREN